MQIMRRFSTGDRGHMSGHMALPRQTDSKTWACLLTSLSIRRQLWHSGNDREFGRLGLGRETAGNGTTLHIRIIASPVLRGYLPWAQGELWRVGVAVKQVPPAGGRPAA